jgi:hypothetical protein
MVTSEELLKSDIELSNTDNWLIDNWFPIGHRGIDVAPEGGCKTTLGCWWSVCIAANVQIFGHWVAGGPVLMIDEETPEADLTKQLDRFSMGLGYHDHTELPITLLCKNGFRFGRKTELDRVLSVIHDLKPKFIRLDSYIAMLPAGRQGRSENDSGSGIAARDDLNRMLDASPGCNILLAAHSPKPVAQWGIKEYGTAAMQELVRGHGSLVGEACDTGFAIKKLSEYPKPLQFAIVTKARRVAVPMSSEIVYVEMKEERYGEGWARLEQVPPIPTPPSGIARELFHLFSDGAPHSEHEITKRSSLHTKKENRLGIEELLANKFILKHKEPFTYRLNPNYKTDVNPDYLKQL